MQEEESIHHPGTHRSLNPQPPHRAMPASLEPQGWGQAKFEKGLDGDNIIYFRPCGKEDCFSLSYPLT